MPTTRRKVRTMEESGESSSSSGVFIVADPPWGTRHTLVLLGFLGFCASYAMRVNLSFAMIAMVLNSTELFNSTDACPDLNSVNAAGHTSPGQFQWTSQDQGIILGAFFWGYVATQVPGGMLAERIGGKWPFGIGMLVTAGFSLLTPWAAREGKWWLIGVRVVQGLGEGVTNPSMHALLARWLPPLERSKMGTVVYAGAQLGTVLAMPLCAFLISTIGWESVFYTMGVGGIIWFVFWTILIHNGPNEHPRITDGELWLIQHSLGGQMGKHRPPTPWRKMLTSPPVLAILVAQTGQGWGLYTLLTELPTYMKTILQFDLKENGWLSALPYLAMWIFSLICSWTADWMRTKGVSTTKVRKIFNSIGHWIPAGALIAAAYSGCHRPVTVFLLTLAVGASGGSYAGYQVNHIDLSPNHAGVMMGVTNGFANLCGIGAPYLAGVVLEGGAPLTSWRLIFFIAAGVYLIDNLIYVLFASGEEQKWNRDGHPEPETTRAPLLGAEEIGGDV